MTVDYASLCFMGASLILGPLTMLIVGSQEWADAKPVACWTLGVLVLLLFVSAAWLASGRADSESGVLGIVVLCSALIVAVSMGTRNSAARHTAALLRAQGKKIKPGPWDDELA